MPFPLHRRAGRIVFLDNDAAYLQMLNHGLPERWHIALFTSPAACAQALRQEVPVWQTDSRAQQEIITKWHAGTPLIPQILTYWRDGGMARLGLTKVCLVDYAMPDMDGLEFLAGVPGCQAARILLTGFADSQVALGAFNAGLIEKFIPKQSPGLIGILAQIIGDLLHASSGESQQPWAQTLNVSQLALLADPAVSAHLEEWSAQRQWAEHVVIGSPFGVLSLNLDGAVEWLQLEAESSLPDLAELAELQGWDVQTVQAIRNGQSLIDVELSQFLEDGRQPAPQSAFAIQGTTGVLYAARFDVGQSVSEGAVNSYRRFKAESGVPLA